jgi:hypothetical protein
MLRSLLRAWPKKLVDTTNYILGAEVNNIHREIPIFQNSINGHLGTTSFSTGIPTGESIEVIRARVFETHIGNNLRSGRKVLRKKPIGDVLMNWYYPNYEKEDPLLIDTDAER